MNTISERAVWQVARVQKWPGFKSAKRILEVGAGSFETLAHLAQAHPGKQFYGVDFELRPPALTVAENAPDNLSVLKHDARDLKLFPENHFDFVFSVALVEHIRELDAHLSEIHRVLRDGGHYCFQASPLWSSSVGHHCDHNALDCPIPHYGHLFMTREQLGDFLLSEMGKSSQESVQILRRVYDRQDLSRLSRSQVRKIVDDSPFRIESWTESKDKNCDEKLMSIVLENNLYSISPGDLSISGIVCSLLKAGHDFEPPSIWRSWVRRIMPVFKT